MTTETAVLSDLLQPVGTCFSREGAERLLQLRASEAVQSRIEDLADKSNAGTLSSDERSEYETLVSAGTFIAILQAQARHLLKEGELA